MKIKLTGVVLLLIIFSINCGGIDNKAIRIAKGTLLSSAKATYLGSDGYFIIWQLRMNPRDGNSRGVFAPNTSRSGEQVWFAISSKKVSLTPSSSIKIEYNLLSANGGVPVIQILKATIWEPIQKREENLERKRK